MANLSLELCRHTVDDILICPVCGAGMHTSDDGRSLLCRGARTHCFDGGGGGYVPLSPRHHGGGDGKDAVRCRTSFLDKGYYAQAREAIVSTVRDYLQPDADVLDAGCGEGYYSNHIAEAGYRVLGCDLSKFAVDTAAKRARMMRGAAPSRTVYAVASVFELPACDESVDAVVNIFAPCAPLEYARVLKPDGYLIVVGAGEDHLFGLKKCLYNDPYLNDERRDLPDETSGLTLIETRNVHFEITVSGQEDLGALFSMTPYYWRTSRSGLERLAAITTLTTPVSFDIHVYKKAT